MEREKIIKEEDQVFLDQKLLSLVVKPIAMVTKRQQRFQSLSRKITTSICYRFAPVYVIITLIACFSIVTPMLGPSWQTVGKFSKNTENVVVTELFELGSETRIIVAFKTGEITSSIGGMISVLLIPEEGNPVPEISESLHLKSQTPLSSQSEPWTPTNYKPGFYKLCIVSYDLEKWEITVTTYI
ncbi:MAG: hypothetical protein ACFFD4_15460 [Candidatus Odinarchaeota archaeon]